MSKEKLSMEASLCHKTAAEVIACIFTAVVGGAHNPTYRYAMYKDKRHASDSSTKLYPHATAHKGSGLLLPCYMPAVLLPY